ncbi:MAG TPA: hypothetical protein VNN20_04130 [Thermodesulfobacteriota bacterium]|nr:hypothetical protein [Thermodesulfobacteriota bacterium]
MQRKSSFVHLLNLLIIGGLAFTGAYLLRNSSDSDGIFKPKSAGTTVDSGSKIVEESGLTSTDNNDVVKGKIVNVTMVEGEPDGQGTRGYVTVSVFDSEGVLISIAIMAETPIFKKTGELLQTASFDDLSSGQTVGVKLDRPVLQTSPIKARAERVLILDTSE